MRRSVPVRVFLDASCWVAAAGSPEGGSAMIIRLSQAGFVKILATRRILLEAERNVGEKMGEEALSRFHRLFLEADMELVYVGGSGAEEGSARARRGL